MGGTWVGHGEGDPQCATIYCRPPKSQMLDVTFHILSFLLLGVSVLLKNNRAQFLQQKYLVHQAPHNQVRKTCLVNCPNISEAGSRLEIRCRGEY